VRPAEESEGVPRVSQAPERQEVRVRRERRGRRGKTVTVVGPLILTREDAKSLFQQWKKMCGSGGALRPIPDQAGYEVEIQGDHADRLMAELQRSGFRANRSGG